MIGQKNRKSAPRQDLLMPISDINHTVFPKNEKLMHYGHCNLV